jgi:hypothetical protein
MAVLCLLTNTPWPWPTPAEGQVQEEGSLPSERSGEGGAKRRSAQAKRGRLGCLLRARGGASQEGPVSLLGLEHMRSHFVVAVAVGPALRAGTSLLRMYGPPRDCKGKFGREDKSAQMYSAFRWRVALLARMSCARVCPLKLVGR